MGKYSVSALLGEAESAASKPKKVKSTQPQTPAWQAGLDATKDGWKARVTTDLEEVSRRFIQSRRTGTDGARRKGTPITIKNYEDDLRIFFASLKRNGVTVWEHVTRKDVSDFVDAMNKRLDNGELRPASIWKVFRTLRALFYFLEKQGELASFRSALPAIPKNTGRHWIPSPEQMRSFMDGFEQDTVWGFRDYVMSTVMLDCGARIGELCNMTPADILWDASMIVLFGKKQQVRKVSLSETKTMPLLKQWSRVRERVAKPGCDKLFTTRNGGKLVVNELNKSFRKNRVATGVGNGGTGAEDERVTPHVFRHYFCTRYLVNGGKIEVLQQITGHEDLSTLMIYVHLAAELSHVKEEHRRVSPLDSLYGDDTKKKRKMY